MSTFIDPQEARRIAESSSQIHMRTFQVAIGVLAGVALCCFVARIGIRLRYQNGLRLDDAFLILAAACLIAATGIMCHLLYYILYLRSAALLFPQILPYLLKANFGKMLRIQERVYTYLALTWTTTFAVKGCFLVFMRPLVWHISRTMNWYYWFIVVFCVISWPFAAVYPFILCPHFGLDAVKCASYMIVETKIISIKVSITVLDVLSDIMVVSLPIIVLWGSQLNRSTKAGVAVFLCLSIFMAICAIVRIVGSISDFHHKGRMDDTWEYFWQYAESAVAVMMASITSFRTLFVKPSRNYNATTPHSPTGNWLHRIQARFQTLATAKPEKQEPTVASAPILKLPKIPRPILTGVRSLIRKNNRTGVGTRDFDTLDSEINAASEDYSSTLKPPSHSDTDNDIL